MNDPINPDVMQKVIQAATNGGACCPAAVAEILRPGLSTEQRGAVTYVYANCQGQILPVEAAVARLREIPRLARLFSPDGKLDLREMSQPEYRAIRKANPELFGLR
jgi:hypothetical protein